jgi:hypothetical protein
MDTSSILIGVITLVIWVIPFALVSRRNKKRSNRNLKLLSDWTTENKLKLDKIESHSDFILGLDLTEKTFIFFKGSSENGIVKIPLFNVSQVQLVKETVVSNDNSVNNSRIISVYLEFAQKSSQSQSLQIELFCIEKNHQLSGEIQLGQEWVKQINNIL